MPEQQALPITVERVAKRSTSRVVRRPEPSDTEPKCSPLVSLAFTGALAQALDRAGVRPGEAFYVVRVPPSDRPSKSADFELPPGPRAETRRAVLAHFARLGNLGNTATDAGIAIGDPGTWRRVSELRQGGHLHPTGKRRRTVNGGYGAVLVITERGRAALEEATVP